MLGNPDMVPRLLEAAADANVTVHNQNGAAEPTTCLEVALENACMDVVRQLARRGTNLDQWFLEG